MLSSLEYAKLSPDLDEPIPQDTVVRLLQVRTAGECDWKEPLHGHFVGSGDHRWESHQVRQPLKLKLTPLACRLE